MAEFDVESNKQNPAPEGAQSTAKGNLESNHQSAEVWDKLRDHSSKNERAAVEVLRDHALRNFNDLDMQQLRELVSERQGNSENPSVPAGEVHGPAGHEHILFRPTHKK